jgi:OOP family OmpA-OmpF porin
MSKRLLTWAAGGILVALGSIVVPGVAVAQNSVVNVPPPQIYEYWLSISRQPAGALVFDGYVPDEQTRARLSQVDGADTSWLKLGSGAPARYDDIVNFGLNVLDRLSEGRFAVRGNIVSLSGVARDIDAYAAVRGQLANSLPNGLILAMAEIDAPRVEPYAFAARRTGNGGVALEGYVPDSSVESALMALVGDGAVSTLRYGSGDPLNFDSAARQGLELLSLMSEGEVRFDGRSWIISGTPASADAARAIQAQFTDRNLVNAGWVLSLSGPVAVSAPAAAPAVAPVAQGQANMPTAPGAEVGAAPVAAPAPAAQNVLTLAQQRAQCAEQLALLSAQNAILFRSGAAVLAPEANAILDQFAATLGICPDVMINIEGHTDSDGEARANLALSVSRAEAVANALIARNVAADRLYVLGFGEAQPIADNSTAAGKAQNRRIVVAVRPD